ncbi:MAG: YbaB/EbfC family nucleoid-associated protein [Bacteroidota bacterium]
MFDILSKLGDVQKKMEEVKTRLDAVYVEGVSAQGQVKVTLTANKKMKAIDIDPCLLFPERKEEVQDFLELAFAEALKKADDISETEMKAAGRDMLPGFPGF